jgi:GntR family transcriptional regulator
LIINLDYQSRTPIYEQIVQEVERYVALGILKPEEQMPSIRDMATELGINPNTVKKAYSILEGKGVIVTLSTKGTYIAYDIKKIVEEKVNSKIEELNVIIGELEKLGISKEEVIKKIK